MSWRLNLVLALAPFASAILPDGFSTFFVGHECPLGWREVPQAKGRMLVSVNDSSLSGITVNTPLGDKEDRGHWHGYEFEIPLPQKEIAAVSGCCNPQGAAKGNYNMDGEMSNSVSGLPFAQLLFCQAEPGTEGQAPYATLAYISSSGGCGDNWAPLAITEGRTLLPAEYEGSPLNSNDTRLSSGEDRTHSHGFQVDFEVLEAQYRGVAGCCNGQTSATGDRTANVVSGATSLGLPYLQLLTCQSMELTFEVDLPQEALLFSTIACPPGYEPFYDLAGRFLVALPENGEAGAVFGEEFSDDEDQIGYGLVSCLLENECLQMIDDGDGNSEFDYAALVNCVQRIPIINPNPACGDKIDVIGLSVCAANCEEEDFFCIAECIFDNAEFGPAFRDNGRHQHSYVNALMTQFTPVALLRGCETILCATGYARNFVYPFEGTTLEAHESFPHVKTTLCRSSESVPTK